MAGLAFVNPRQAYVSQGAFCSLPIRPFWFRLALTWVPRYIIVLTIIGLAIAIYAHVGFEFRAYSNIDSSFQSLKTYDGSNATANDTQQEPKMEDITFELTNMQPRPKPQRRKSSIGHDIFTAQRESSSALALSPTSSYVPQRVSFDSGAMSRSLPGSTINLVRSRPDSTRPVLVPIPSGQSVLDAVSPLDQTRQPCHRDNNRNANPELIASSPSSKSTRTTSPSSLAMVSLAKQRQRIHRQLRLMFIYPLVYTLMWLIPFAMHCMNYWDRYAMRPVEFLRVGSSICICLIGFVDALIFSLREKPWRGIESSDGTFWGSFFVVRRPLPDVEVDANGNAVRRSVSAARKARGSASYRTSASGDYARIAAEQARQRLDLEREERLKTVGERTRRESQALVGVDPGMVDDLFSSLNVGDGKEGQVYDDNGLEDDTVVTAYQTRSK